mgnify:CR=1 FL=1
MTARARQDQDLAPDDRVRRAARSVFFVFALNGFVFASWVSRLPAVREQLDLTPGEMGLVLLVGAAGALVALPLTGLLVDKVGSANATRIAAAACSAGLIVAAVAVGAGSTTRVAISSFGAAMGVGAWDVAMNIQGGAVEHRFGRALMPRLHAGFSLGAVGGAGAGVLAASAGFSVTAQVVTTSALAAVATLIIVGGYLPDAAGSGPHGVPQPNGDPQVEASPGNAFSAWSERRTVLLGLVVLAAALTEGGANDWLAIAVVDGFDTSEAVGAMAFGAFVAAMTGMRLVGTRLLDRFGRVAVLRVSAGCALVGLVVFGVAPGLPLAMAGALVWGLGTALGFPVGMSAASDDPAHAAARVSVVASIGYIAFLGGPPLLGMLADHLGYRPALMVIAGPLVVGLVLASAARPVEVGEPETAPEALPQVPKAASQSPSGVLKAVRAHSEGPLGDAASL